MNLKRNLFILHTYTLRTLSVFIIKAIRYGNLEVRFNLFYGLHILFRIWFMGNEEGLLYM